MIESIQNTQQLISLYRDGNDKTKHDICYYIAICMVRDGCLEQLKESNYLAILPNDDMVELSKWAVIENRMNIVQYMRDLSKLNVEYALQAALAHSREEIVYYLLQFVQPTQSKVCTIPIDNVLDVKHPSRDVSRNCIPQMKGCNRFIGDTLAQLCIDNFEIDAGNRFCKRLGKVQLWVVDQKCFISGTYTLLDIVRCVQMCILSNKTGLFDRYALKAIEVCGNQIKTQSIMTGELEEDDFIYKGRESYVYLRRIGDVRRRKCLKQKTKRK